MRIHWQRTRAVALAAAASCVCGCSSTRPQALTSNNPLPERHAQLALDETQQQRAAAMAHFAAGLALQLENSPEAALAEYRQALDMAPGNLQLTLQVAQLQMNRSDFTNAVTLLEDALRMDPKNADAWYVLGLAYKNTDQIDKAISAGHSALKINAGHLNAIRLLLEIYTQRGTAADINGVIEPALKESNSSAGYWVGLGDILMALLRLKPSLAGDVDRGLIQQCYEKAAELAPNEFDIQARLAETYTENGDYRRAADIYAKLLQARPDSQQILERLWRTYVRSDQKDKAIATLEELSKRDRLRFEIYTTLGDLYEETGKTDAAISNYQQSLVLNPNQFELYVRIALAQMKLKKYDDCDRTLLEAKEKFPTKYQVPYLMGLLQNDRKDYTNALASFADAEALARVDPDDIKLSSAFYFTYGSACERSGDPERAAILFRKAIDLDKNNHNAFNYLGYMWADKGIRLDESLELIQQALKLDPDNGAYLDSLGWVLFKLGRYDEALPQLRRAVENLEKDNREEDAVVLDHLAEVLLKLGNRDEALHTWKRALEADPANKEVAEKLQKYTSNHTATH